MLRNTIGAAVAMVLAIAPTASAQTKPWELFLDSASTAACDVINADNAELVLISATSQLAIVTGTDVTLEDTLVDDDGFVFFEGDPVGTIDFATDGDGLRSIWWMSLTVAVVNVNDFTGEPTPTNKSPADFSNVACDACQFWDDPLDGHAIKAVVVPAEGAALTEEEVRRHCRARLETYMVPKLVEFCTSLPKTESGKIRRAVVG